MTADYSASVAMSGRAGTSNHRTGLVRRKLPCHASLFGFSLPIRGSRVDSRQQKHQYGKVTHPGALVRVRLRKWGLGMYIVPCLVEENILIGCE